MKAAVVGRLWASPRSWPGPPCTHLHRTEPVGFAVGSLTGAGLEPGTDASLRDSGGGGQDWAPCAVRHGQDRKGGSDGGLF